MDSDESRDSSSGSDSEDMCPRSPRSGCSVRSQPQSPDGENWDAQPLSPGGPPSSTGSASPQGPQSPMGPQSPDPYGSRSPTQRYERRSEPFTAYSLFNPPTKIDNNVPSPLANRYSDVQQAPRSPDFNLQSPSPEQYDSVKSPDPELQVPVTHPRSPSPEQYDSPPPKRDATSPEPYHDSIKSPSVHSNSSQEEYRQSSNVSPKSSSSQSSEKTRSSKSPENNSPRNSVSSTKSSERHRLKSPVHPKDSSDSSDSSRDSHSNEQNNRLDAQAEEISDVEMEYEGGKDSDDELKRKPESKITLSHEYLSDVSDLDSLGAPSDEETPKEEKPKTDNDLRHKIDEAKNRKVAEKQSLPEKTSKTEDGEEQLDFEAEDGECIEDVKTKGSDDAEEGESLSAVEKEVEEGEVTDDDEVRPEETEPRPVCRFYSRGQCTWGASCRFLHPGVTDKGNYTMFELIRPMVPGPGYGVPDFREDRPGFGVLPGRGDPPIVESAWERGLRTAKEMMRKAIKRKEQDMDFEEKKMNLTLAQDELDKENGYYTRSASPPPADPIARHYIVRPPAAEYRPPRVPEEYYGRHVIYEPEVRTVRVEPEYEAPRERVRSYRELPTHRMPDYYNDKYEEPAAAAAAAAAAKNAVVGAAVTAARRPKREVILQRIDTGRGDEWADPWMRSKSPGGRAKSGRYRRHSYSSASSYSSSSSSRSSSVSSKSSYRGDSRSRSHSPSSRARRRGKSPPARSHRVSGSSSHRNVSPSVIVSEKKAANERALSMNPPAPSLKKAHKDNRPPSPGMMRTSAQNPPAPSKNTVDQYGRTKDRGKHEADRKKLAVAAALASKISRRVSRSSSGSDSSGSSSSDSESSYSSSSSSGDGSPTPRRKVPEKGELAAAILKVKAIDALKTGGDKRQIKLNLKSQLPKKPGLAELAELRKEKNELAQGKKRPASSPIDDTIPKLAAVAKAANNKKSTSRREELLKQLKAVEDAIAKKRSKIN